MEKRIIDVEFVNLCPHDVVFYAADGTTVLGVLPRSGAVARAKVSTVEQDHIYRVKNLNNALIEDGSQIFGEPEDLPDPKEGFILIVSLATVKAAQAHGRSTADLKAPGIGVRDPKGVIVGCKGVSTI